MPARSAVRQLRAVLPAEAERLLGLARLSNNFREGRFYRHAGLNRADPSLVGKQTACD